MTNIQVFDETNATGELRAVYEEWQRLTGRVQIPGIFQCFSHRPDFLRAVIGFSGSLQFSDGHLPRRTKEMLSTFVSALNQCPY